MKDLSLHRSANDSIQGPSLELNLGNNRFVLRWSEKDALYLAHATVSLVLEVSEEQRTFSTNMVVTYRGRHVGKFSINAFGKTTISFDLNHLQPGAPLNLQVNADSLASHSNLNLAYSGKSCVMIKSFIVSGATDFFRGRDELCLSAATIAQRLGLHGLYMFGEKLDSLTKDTISALESGTGFSAVRLGDGEGRVLGALDLFFSSRIDYSDIPLPFR